MQASRQLTARCGPVTMRCAPMPAKARISPATRRVLVGRPRTGPVVVVASTGFAPRSGEEATGSGGGGHGALGPFMSVPDTVLNRGGSAFGDENVGSGSMLGTVLERNRVNIIMPTPPEKALKLDDGGDGGGIGKNNHNGGGGGDGGGDDDDDFFGEEGDGDGDGEGGPAGAGFFRLRIPELFDRAALAAVLQEWFKTVADLPLFIRRSVEMGLFSSAQLVRFLSMDVRPNVTRAVSRRLPTSWAREFVGRLMADPAFVQKLAIEQSLAFTVSMLHEWRTRGEAFKNELDLAVINSMGFAAAVGATVWVTAPSRAMGAVHKFPWQKMLAELPHCVFDASGPLRAYTPAARVGGFFASMAQLSAVGAAAGAATSGAASLAVAARRRADPSFEPSVPVPSAARSSGGLGAFFALNANVRYQLLGGLDRYLFGHASALWSYVALTTIARVGGAAVGELSRPWWQGLPTEAAASHAQRRTRVRKVKRRVVKRPAAAQQPAEAALAPAVAAVAAGGAEQALDGSGAFEAFVQQQRAEQPAEGQQQQGQEPEEQQQRQVRAAASASDYEGEAAASGPGSFEAEVEGRLTSAPALMGSPEGLSALARQQSFSNSAMGGALRDAVGTEVAA